MIKDKNKVRNEILVLFLQLSHAAIWLPTFRASLTCFELLSVENVNASKWFLINYLGECFTPARSYSHKQSPAHLAVFAWCSVH